MRCARVGSLSSRVCTGSRSDTLVVLCNHAGCGEGSLNPGFEECDDGDAIPGDGCSAACQV